jgi:hypothetical protein
MAGGVVHLPLYATGFRGDDLQGALELIAPLSTRYGATRYEVFRSRDDRYKFLLSVTEMRAACSGWYQVPLLYVWNDRVADGAVREPAITAGEASA